jgi:hypothetical protein
MLLDKVYYHTKAVVEEGGQPYGSFSLKPKYNAFSLMSLPYDILDFYCLFNLRMYGLPKLDALNVRLGE